VLFIKLSASSNGDDKDGTGDGAKVGDNNDDDESLIEAKSEARPLQILEEEEVLKAAVMMLRMFPSSSGACFIPSWMRIASFV